MRAVQGLFVCASAVTFAVAVCPEACAQDLEDGESSLVDSDEFAVFMETRPRD